MDDLDVANDEGVIDELNLGKGSIAETEDVTMAVVLRLVMLSRGEANENNPTVQTTHRPVNEPY